MADQIGDRFMGRRAGQQLAVGRFRFRAQLFVVVGDQIGVVEAQYMLQQQTGVQSR